MHISRKISRQWSPAVEQYVVNSVAGEGVGRAVRFAHAKGYGLVRAEVEILDGLPPGYAQGIYATPGRHDALIRFSNGVAHLGADATLSNAFGLALKMFDIAGTTLLDDEPDAGTFDYNTINMPVFFCNTVSHYLFIQQLFTDAPSYFARGKAGAHQLLSEFLTGKGTLAEKDWAWDELLAFLATGSTARRRMSCSRPTGRRGLCATVTSSQRCASLPCRHSQTPSNAALSIWGPIPTPTGMRWWRS